MTEGEARVLIIISGRLQKLEDFLKKIELGEMIVGPILFFLLAFGGGGSRRKRDRVPSSSSAPSNNHNGVRVNKILSEKFSRRVADRFVDDGAVTINGCIAKHGDLVIPSDFVKLNGKRVRWCNNV